MFQRAALAAFAAGPVSRLFRRTPPAASAAIPDWTEGREQRKKSCRMCLRALILVVLTAGGALCQAPSTPSTAVPDEILYRAFFVRVVWLDDVARQIDAKGQDGSDARGRVRKEAGITLADEERLKSIAQRWKEQNDAIVAQMRALGNPDGTISNPQRAEQLTAQRRQAVLDGVNELKAVFGPARFARLESWIRATSRVRLGTSGGKSGGGR